MMKLLGAVTIFAIGCVLLPATSLATSDVAHQCDMLAAHPADTGKDADVPGVVFENLSYGAIPACEAAVTAEPTNQRVKYELARALQAEGKDMPRAVKLFGETADAGIGLAALSLAYLYKDGNGVEQSWEKTNAMLVVAGKDPITIQTAKFLLGSSYELGTGTAVDVGKAISLYKEADEAGMPIAANRIGLLYKNGSGVAADAKEALVWFEKGADRGDGEAAFHAALMLDEGDGVTADLPKAISYYQKGAERGNTGAMVNLGVSYENGRGVPQDVSKANDLYRKAAELGDGDAMSNLGMNFIEGKGLAKDEQQGFELLQRGYDKGSPVAAFNVGLQYDTGKLTVAHPGKAADALIDAIKLHAEQAKELLVDHKGEGLSDATLLAIKIKLVTKGIALEKDGLLSDAAVAYLDGEFKK